MKRLSEGSYFNNDNTSFRVLDIFDKLDGNISSDINKISMYGKDGDSNTVKMLSDVEEKIEKDFNETLESRFSMMIYWIILARLVSYDNVLIYDKVGRFYDINGVIGFGDESESNEQISDRQTIIIKTDDENVENEYVFDIKDTRISVTDKAGKCIYLFDSKNYFKISNLTAKGGE